MFLIVHDQTVTFQSRCSWRDQKYVWACYRKYTHDCLWAHKGNNTLSFTSAYGLSYYPIKQFPFISYKISSMDVISVYCHLVQFYTAFISFVVFAYNKDRWKRNTNNQTWKIKPKFADAPKVNASKNIYDFISLMYFRNICFSKLEENKWCSERF